jgi:hypothetical protein
MVRKRNKIERKIGRIAEKNRGREGKLKDKVKRI